MTAAEREALLERAAIMEYDGGMDRQAAALTAFAWYYPADYTAMRERVKAYPDGEAVIYEWLEELLQEPAPDKNTQQKKNGLEGLKEYVRRKPA
jgi:hypothetical protein